MDKIEVFHILGIEETREERLIRQAYREKLTVTNPEDNPEGFKRLRQAYEEACRLAKQPEGEEPGKVKDETPSGIWMEKAQAIYGNIRRRRNVEEWKKLFDEDCFLALEEEENCRVKLLRFLMDHFRLPGDVWKLLDRKLCITSGAAALREKFPADFVSYILSKCERGEDVEFDQFEGEDEAPYDLFLQHYDRCWQALQEEKPEQAQQEIDSADALNISHPALEVCRAELLEKQGKSGEALALFDRLLERFPKDTMICYNAAEMLWRQGTEKSRCRVRAAEIYKQLKEENDSHYMANVRLTEWYYDNGKYKEAKKCAEKVLSAGSGDEFLKLLHKVNEEIEKDLEVDWRGNGGIESALELCWCYLQDGKISRGIRLAQSIEKRLPPGKRAEWNGLMAKLYVEEAEYEESIALTYSWEAELKKKLSADESGAEREKDQDRLRQAHLIRMQCYHNLGFKEEAKFAEAIREGESVLTGGSRDIGILLEMAQIYIEMEEYEKCEKTVRGLVEDYQVYAGYAASLEASRRQLNPGGVIRAGSLCIKYFPTYVKAYEYMAKVYLDLEQFEDLERVFSDAEKNGIKSDILAAYKYQRGHEPMDLDILNGRLKAFRKEIRKPLEEGKVAFYEAGLSKLTEYLYNCPDSYMFVERGIFHRVAHHYREAIEDFEKALALNPSNAYALNGLSFVYRYMGDFEKALFYIKKAILYIDEDMSPVIYTDMADLYSLLGDYERALSACRQYREITDDQSIWFLEQLAKVYVSLGAAEKACEVYGRYADRDKWKSYENSVDACIKCGLEQKARELLSAWARELGVKTEGLGKLFCHIRASSQDRQKYIVLYQQLAWTELVFGKKEAAATYIREHYLDRSGWEEAHLADAVFICILSGMDKLGKKYSEQLKEWLQKEKFSGSDKYFVREKGHLHLESMAAWYTQDEAAIQALLDKEPECGICHFCVCPVCHEMEAVRILFLLRQGKREEARECLERNLELFPASEYLLAIRHCMFA